MKLIIGLAIQIIMFGPAIYMARHLTRTYGSLDLAPGGLQLIAILLLVAPIAIGAWVHSLYEKNKRLKEGLSSYREDQRHR